MHIGAVMFQFKQNKHHVTIQELVFHTLLSYDQFFWLLTSDLKLARVLSLWQISQ